MGRLGFFYRDYFVFRKSLSLFDNGHKNVSNDYSFRWCCIFNWLGITPIGWIRHLGYHQCHSIDAWGPRAAGPAREFTVERNVNTVAVLGIGKVGELVAG